MPPYFFDINAKLDFAISEYHKLTVSGLFSNERMDAYFDENPHYKGNLSWKSRNGVATARLRSILSDFFLSDFILSWSAVDRSSRQPGDGIEDAADKEVSIKQDFTTIHPSLELHFGAWLAWEQQRVEINQPKETAIKESRKL